MHCSALAHRIAVDNDHKRWWLTWWKTKVPISVLNFFLGFISDGIVSTLCTLAFGDVHIIEH